jgi:hypothetical protein
MVRSSPDDFPSTEGVRHAPGAVQSPDWKFPTARTGTAWPGGLIGGPIEVIAGPRTGLPIPSHAEIAFEGFIHPSELRDEGRLGEWNGYNGGVAPGPRKDRTSPFVAAARERPSTPYFIAMLAYWL